MMDREYQAAKTYELMQAIEKWRNSDRVKRNKQYKNEEVDSEAMEAVDLQFEEIELREAYDAFITIAHKQLKTFSASLKEE